MKVLSFLALALVAVVSAQSVRADNPDTGMSTWDNTVGISPKNQSAPANFRYQFTGTLRTMAGVPVPNFPAAQMELDFGSCLNPSTRPQNQIPADGDSDANGFVVWSANLNFGGGDPCMVRVLVQNVVYKTLAAHLGLPNGMLDGGVRSPDENGDGLIGLADLAIFQAEFVNTGTRVDYRGDLAQASGIHDGLTTLADLAFFRAHFVAP